MEHQAGAGRSGPAGENTSGDSESDGGERALADAAEAAQAAPELPATGEPRVDAALKLLERLPGLPVSDHPQLFEQVHAQLSEVLGDLDSGGSVAGPAGG